jgi:hypothetical protein
VLVLSVGGILVRSVRVPHSVPDSSDLPLGSTCAATRTTNVRGTRREPGTAEPRTEPGTLNRTRNRQFRISTTLFVIYRGVIRPIIQFLRRKSAASGWPDSRNLAAEPAWNR